MTARERVGPPTKPPGGNLSRPMLKLLVELWDGDRIQGVKETADALERRGLLTLRGINGEHLIYPKLTRLGIERAYWCQFGRLP